MNFRKMSLFVVFALVAVSLGPTTHHSALSPSRANAVLADGGKPMPPPPPIVPGASASSVSILTADGGKPMPPPPPIVPGASASSVSILTADGGKPMPPPAIPTIPAFSV